jgi:hypothetical protein
MSTLSVQVPSMSTALVTVPAPPPATDTTQIKLESLTTTLVSLSKVVKSILHIQQAGATKPKTTGAASAGMNASGPNTCNFCGGPGHFIQECEIVEEFIRFGKCKRSTDSKVVLPTGAQVPRSIQGQWLRDRVEEWHRQNPRQMAVQMYVKVTAALAATALSHDTAGQSYYSYPTSAIDQ